MTIYAMVGTVGGALFGAMPAGGGTTQTALGGSRFFVNAERIWERMKALGGKMEPKPKVVAVDVSRVPDLEYTALKI
jgi:MFS superfamily sulfate permease-like transporter